MGRARSCTTCARGNEDWNRAPRRARGPYSRTEASVEAALRAFCEGLARFPTLGDIDAAGRSDLRGAVQLRGVAYWADRLGLDVEETRLRLPYSEADALRDARAVIAQEGYLPGEHVLRRLNFTKLATAVHKSGGAARFRELYNLP